MMLLGRSFLKIHCHLTEYSQEKNDQTKTLTIVSIKKVNSSNASWSFIPIRIVQTWHSQQMQLFLRSDNNLRLSVNIGIATSWYKTDVHIVLWALFWFNILSKLGVFSMGE
jgi:hypothetical protein